MNLKILLMYKEEEVNLKNNLLTHQQVKKLKDKADLIPAVVRQFTFAQIADILPIHQQDTAVRTVNTAYQI